MNELLRNYTADELKLFIEILKATREDAYLGTRGICRTMIIYLPNTLSFKHREKTREWLDVLERLCFSVKVKAPGDTRNYWWPPHEEFLPYRKVTLDNAIREITRHLASEHKIYIDLREPEDISNLGCWYTIIAIIAVVGVFIYCALNNVK